MACYIKALSIHRIFKIWLATYTYCASDSRKPLPIGCIDVSHWPRSFSRTTSLVELCWTMLKSYSAGCSWLDWLELWLSDFDRSGDRSEHQEMDINRKFKKAGSCIAQTLTQSHSTRWSSVRRSASPAIWIFALQCPGCRWGKFTGNTATDHDGVLGGLVADNVEYADFQTPFYFLSILYHTVICCTYCDGMYPCIKYLRRCRAKYGPGSRMKQYQQVFNKEKFANKNRYFCNWWKWPQPPTRS